MCSYFFHILLLQEIANLLVKKRINPLYLKLNGKWIDNTEIPADRTRWGSFDELRKNTDEDVMAILKEAINDKSIDPNSDQAKAINLYKSILDTVTRDKQGIRKNT